MIMYVCDSVDDLNMHWCVHEYVCMAAIVAETVKCVSLCCGPTARTFTHRRTSHNTQPTIAYTYIYLLHCALCNPMPLALLYIIVLYIDIVFGVSIR